MNPTPRFSINRFRWLAFIVLVSLVLAPRQAAAIEGGMRPWTEAVYGVPPEQVVGSSIKTQYELRPDGPVLLRLPQVAFVDDKAGKPVGINEHIGRRPVAAFGNSDGDQQMLEWTTIAAKGARLALLVHHTDAAREYAYDKGAEKALAEAKARNWTVVDMQRDWKVIYPPEQK